MPIKWIYGILSAQVASPSLDNCLSHYRTYSLGAPQVSLIVSVFQEVFSDFFPCQARLWLLALYKKVDFVHQ